MKFSTLFKIFLIIIFFIGLGLYAMGTLHFALPKEGFNNNIECPDLLIQNGEKYFLYNSKKPTVEGVNPKVFTKLSDYSNYVKMNPSCPVLFLQKGFDAQGNETYNVHGGTPLNTYNFNGLDKFPPLGNGNIRGFNNTVLRTTKLVDASLENPPYNIYNKTPGYAPFDPRGHDIGKFNPLDAIHISGELLKISDSPSDPNWGGPEYTEQAVKSGKYKGNEVYRPVFSGGPNVVVK